MQLRILGSLFLLVNTHSYCQTSDSAIVFDFEKHCDPFFNSKKADSTFCHFYVSEKKDTVYFSNLECMASRQTTTPPTFKYYLQNGLANGSVRVFFDFGNYSSVLDGQFVKGSLTEGAVREYYKDGNLKSTGQFLNGHRYGIWSWYYENGQLQRLITYNLGDPTDEQVFRKKAEHANDKLSDSLLISYYIGCDCSKTIQSEALRGGCENWQKLEYRRKRRAYIIKSAIFKESFRPWKDRLQENLIRDSIHKPVFFQNRKLSTKKLETFLKEISSIYSDTVFAYQISDVPEKIRKKNEWSEENRDSLQIDALIRSSLQSVVVSSVVMHFTISYQLGGKQYKLYKNSNDSGWSFYEPGKENSEIRFIWFAFDDFLFENLPKKFSGRRIFRKR